MTWDMALRIADQQIAVWVADGIGPADAELTLHNEQPAHWYRVRQQLAAWVMLHRDRWED
jgi:hypothetical protein